LTLPAQLTPAQLEALDRFEHQLRDRGIALGLIAPGDRDRMRERHIEDSLRAVRCIGPGDRLVVDLGSGGGLPGIPLAIALPSVEFVLVEARRRRAAFLEMATADLSLPNVIVQVRRAEDLRIQADLCVARAFAPPLASWRAAERLLGPGGRLVYFGGATWSEGRQGAELLRAGIATEICAPKQFNWQGPLVIMGKFSSTDGSQDHEPKHQ
jgi:16S rRNA (guanine527-N7)-methyltransferase